MGKVPAGAVLTPDGRELYVSNTGDNTVSVISTVSHSVTKVLPVGTNPSSLVVSHDGHIYVGNRDTSISIIDTATKSVENLAIPLMSPCGAYNGGNNGVADVALTPDGTKLYLAMVWAGLETMDTATRTFSCVSKIPCPEGLAVSRTGHLYVSYQCWGPDGTPAHAWLAESGAWDTVAVFQNDKARVERCRARPQLCGGHDTVAEFDMATGKIDRVFAQGFPNVGGWLALSSDGSELWITGNDACIAPYDHQGCPRVPGGVVNVLSTSDGKLLKSYGLSLEEGTGRISVSPSPHDEVFVGDGIHLKEILSNRNISLPEQPTLLPIASVGDVAFSPGGNNAYLAVEDKNVVYVMRRAKPGIAESYEHVRELTLPTVLSVLSTRGDYGRCAAKDTCIRVIPEDLASELAKRGPTEPLRDCGKQVAEAQSNKSHDHPLSELYRCVANEVLAAAPSEGVGRMQAIDWAMDLRALEANEDFIEFKTGFMATQEKLAQLKEKRSADREEIAKLSKQVAEDRQNSWSFNDVTSRLSDSSKLQKSLGTSAVILGVFSWGQHTFTVLISKDEKILQDDRVDWNTLQQEAQSLDDRLSTAEFDTHSPEAAKQLYNKLIGEGKVSEKLTELKKLAPQENLTLVWVTEGELRSVPMAALSPDGQHYLVETYSNAVLTTLAPELTEHGGWEALAAGASNPNSALGLDKLLDVPCELGFLFSAVHGEGSNNDPTAFCDPMSPFFSSTPQLPEADKIRANVLLGKHFTPEAFSDALKELHRNGQENKHSLVFIASHFVLNPNAGEKGSFLLTGDQKQLNLWELSHGDIYPFNGVSLVIFSACQTAAMMPSRTGDEIEGVAFHLDERGNGAHAVVATLWKISPPSSTRLMETLEEGLQKGMSKAEALREGQKSMIAAEQSPDKWAPFILIGDWN